MSKYIYHEGTGTLIATSECKVVDAFDLARAYLEVDAPTKEEVERVIENLSEGEWEARASAEKVGKPLDLG